MPSNGLGRRDFLKVAGFGGAALLLSPRLTALGWRSPNTTQTQVFVPDAEVSLTATDKMIQILPGAQTRVYNYEGKLLSGSGVTVGSVPGSYLGPILRVKSGTKLRINIQNKLIEDSTVHPHTRRAEQGMMGLAGLMYVWDADEEAAMDDG